MVEQSVLPHPSAQAVDNAVRWYWLSKERIVAAMPIVCPGTTFNLGSLQSLERAISQWQSGDSSLCLSSAYIVFPLRRIKGAIAQNKLTGQVPVYLKLGALN